jgi:hypothetical protein
MNTMPLIPSVWAARTLTVWSSMNTQLWPASRACRALSDRPPGLVSSPRLCRDGNVLKALEQIVRSQEMP